MHGYLFLEFEQNKHTDINDLTQHKGVFSEEQILAMNKTWECFPGMDLCK